MLDYHVHLWPHPEVADESELAVARLAEYCEAAAKAGVSEIAITEHFHRFTKGRELVEGWWSSEADVARRADVEHYFDHHSTADLDLYMDTVSAAKDAGLPIVAGLEVDFYPGMMDEVAAMLAGYPFDVLLGSIHWLGTWMYDIIDSPLHMSEWERTGNEGAWRAYAEAIEELAATRTCDVLAHPDLVKVAARYPDPGVVREVEDRICAAAASSGMAGELSSAGFRKPAHEQYPSSRLLGLLRGAGVPLTTASDTHGIRHVADRSGELRALAEAAGYSELQAFRGRLGLSVPLGGLGAVAADGVGTAGAGREAGGGGPDLGAPGAGPDLTDSKMVP